MAFALVKINQGRINQPEPEYLKVGATYAVNKGDALALTGGLLVPAGADTDGAATKYIAMADGAVGTVIPVCKITPEMLWETTFSAAATGIKIGDKVALNVTTTSTEKHAIGVTATTTKGVATVAEMFGTDSGDTVYVRFEYLRKEQ